MKKLLVVAYYFPPYGSVGGVRMTKLVKYFHRLGWELTVVTVSEEYYEKNEIDYNKFVDIPEAVQVIRTKRWAAFTSFQEEGLYWAFPLYKELKKQVTTTKFDYILYTGGPYFHWIIAPVLKKKMRIPYILDFRDPWLLTPYNQSAIRRRVASKIEPNVIKEASFILNVTEDATNMYKKQYCNEKDNKFITIPNGYDPEDFTNVIEKSSNVEGIKIVYTGKFGTFRNPFPLFHAIQKYNEGHEEKINFIHVGKQEKVIQEFIENKPTMRKYIHETGFLPYKEALQYVKGADYTVLISGGHPYEPTTKVYDYMALHKHILCINDIRYGYLHNLLFDQPFSSVVNNDETEIYEALMYLNKRREADTKYIDTDQFNRKNIYENLNDILKEICHEDIAHI
ncbi:glycosyltransferase [Bacillus sp. DX4.1]|uniref:glycosyltransferase n=1 Tax=Bacillus sp. DX4.1 TaxID=3055867 RepID=UPI0025A157BA|nr:glycosyltransferase [Bacillus sp. DX4.1]MDM5187899.1 glycosyltransferase [Bacillus sp. DX4.1]